MFVQRMTADETAVLYNTAKVFVELCNQLQITCWLSHGSLLGAWRHQAVIPWDDDLDIAFPREFVAVLESVAFKRGWCFQRMGPFLAKVWNPSHALHKTSYSWTWPFVDVTLYDYYKNKVIIEYNHHNNFCAFDAVNILPIKLYEFGPSKMPIPAKPNVLLDCIYPNWDKRPTSSNWCHRLEKQYEEPVEQKLISELAGSFSFFNVNKEVNK